MNLMASEESVSWLHQWMEKRDISLWGVADLREFRTPADESGKSFPFAISWAVPMNPDIMLSIQNGPNQPYADEYERVNNRINQMADLLSNYLNDRGFRSKPLAASVRSDPVGIKGDFPQKTAATRAGLGWIGRNCQLVTRPFGPWVRLGTVFMDMELHCGTPVDRDFCGRCTQCVDACPAGALQGGAWHAGIERETILDAPACDHWKKKNYFQYHKGHNCGICSAVCPYGVKSAKATLPK
jgi:epoxyqueuosine reductase QueG